MARSNSVYGPARRPIFDPAAVFGDRRRHQAGAPIQEISWSWGGDLHPEDLAANPSPAWIGVDYVLLGGTAADVELLQCSILWEDSLTSDTTSVVLHSDSGTVDTIALGSSDTVETHNIVGVIIPGDERLWVEASSTGDTGDLIGHGLSYILRYRYVAHVDAGPE